MKEASPDYFSGSGANPLSVPLSIGAPAAIAAAAYFNARTHLFSDIYSLLRVVDIEVSIARREKLDHVSLFYTLEKHALAKETANHPFLAYEGKEWTYKETYDISLKHGQWLKTKHAVDSNEVVAMDFMNSPQLIFLCLGLYSIGACPAFINYNLTGKALLHCIATSKARVILVDEEIQSVFTPSVRDALSSSSFVEGRGAAKMVIYPTMIPQEILSYEPIRVPNTWRSGKLLHHMAALVFTSGTTGLPKAAVVSWKKVLVGGEWTTGWIGITRDDRIYTCMPMYHSTAFLLGFSAAMTGGLTLILGHRFSNKTFWPEARSQNATVIQYVGETFRYLLAAPPQIDHTSGENLDKKNKVRLAYGNGLRQDVWKRVQERFDIGAIAEFYSATESTSATWNLSRNNYRLGAVGFSGALASYLLRSKLAIVKVDWETETPFRDPANQSFCIKLPRGESGELLFRIADPATIEREYQGYFNNPKASQSKIMRDVFQSGDAFFRTGDIVRWDKEGRWWFCDRIGDTYRWKSENVSTAEVSDVLGAHPVIQEANVYGVELPHHEGRAGCAAVTLNREIGEELLKELARHASDSLPRYAVPLFLRVTKVMQATGNNKQLKHGLRVQGVDPKAMKECGDKMFWLKGGQYVEFDDEGWRSIEAGAVKL